MTEWIDTSKELPPCDGKYQVTNTFNTWVEVFEYDGYGFKDDQGIYQNPRYWKTFKKLEKRYGMVNECPPN